MDSLFANRDTLLSMINEELGSAFNDFAPALRAWRENSAVPDVNICGFPCAGDCATCTQSSAELQAFFAPQDHIAIMVSEASASAEGGNSAADPSESEGTAAVMVSTSAITTEDADRALENARSLDAIDEMIRSGEAHDVALVADDDYDGECDCLECRTGHAPELWVDDRDDDDRGYDDYDDGHGLDWNESGYFD
jgi:hypothetical protein